MPNMDGTGPTGNGPRTGYGMGQCGGGMRMRRICQGCGCGRRNFISPKNELAALEDEEKALEEELVVIREEKLALKNQQK